MSGRGGAAWSGRARVDSKEMDGAGREFGREADDDDEELMLEMLDELEYEVDSEHDVGESSLHVLRVPSARMANSRGAAERDPKDAFEARSGGPILDQELRAVVSPLAVPVAATDSEYAEGGQTAAAAGGGGGGGGGGGDDDDDDDDVGDVDEIQQYRDDDDADADSPLVGPTATTSNANGNADDDGEQAEEAAENAFGTVPSRLSSFSRSTDDAEGAHRGHGTLRPEPRSVLQAGPSPQARHETSQSRSRRVTRRHSRPDVVEFVEDPEGDSRRADGSSEPGRRMTRRTRSAGPSSDFGTTARADDADTDQRHTRQHSGVLRTVGSFSSRSSHRGEIDDGERSHAASSSAGVRWRAEVAGYAEDESAGDESDSSVDAGYSSGGRGLASRPQQAFDLLLGELGGLGMQSAAVRSTSEWETRFRVTIDRVMCVACAQVCFARLLPSTCEPALFPCQSQANPPTTKHAQTNQQANKPTNLQSTGMNGKPNSRPTRTRSFSCGRRMSDTSSKPYAPSTKKPSRCVGK